MHGSTLSFSQTSEHTNKNTEQYDVAAESPPAWSCWYPPLDDLVWYDDRLMMHPAGCSGCSLSEAATINTTSLHQCQTVICGWLVLPRPSCW